MKKNNKNNLISISPPAPSEIKNKVPEKFYPNSDTCKEKIFLENKNKSGIYMWKNNLNNKRYIGSAVDLSNRLSFYYSAKAMENSLKNSQSYIYNAILKYGYSNFSFTILEYCEPEQCLEREDFYLCSLPHEYNILEKAGSSLGRKHSDATKEILSEANKGSAARESTRARCAPREKSYVWKKSF